MTPSSARSAAGPGTWSPRSPAPPARPATYLLHFGENYRHFHALIAARGTDIPAELRGGNILRLLPGHADAAAAVALAPAVRAAYQHAARSAASQDRLR